MKLETVELGRVSYESMIKLHVLQFIGINKRIMFLISFSINVRVKVGRTMLKLKFDRFYIDILYDMSALKIRIT